MDLLCKPGGEEAFSRRAVGRNSGLTTVEDKEARPSLSNCLDRSTGECSTGEISMVLERGCRQPTCLTKGHGSDMCYSG